MNNAKAIAASTAMVMAAALGTGGLLAWQQSGAAPAAPVAAAPEPAEIVVEYVDESAPEVIAADATASADAMPGDAMPAEAEVAPDGYEGEGDAEAEYEHGDDYEDDDYDEDGEDD